MTFWGTGRKLPIRGGNWNNGANAGVFALNLNNPRSNVNTNIGFRSALPESQKLLPKWDHPVHGGKGTRLPAERQNT
ncbi:hypothetical protein SK3146_02527 [Paenibacillus konkukensis]|uniref:Sulfatase-modifying factor enzyme domain-containing protein n=1 Tax=Paenibacillus konkukensis TaxID=2020716 RepID=A0ABY4RMC6_9BACL|nr:hypothetical protein SK3146_02527 [Paenibacillus konkukensis]